MAIFPVRKPAEIDVNDRKNGEAELTINDGQVEFSIRLDADQVDDLQAALEEVGHSMEEYHREKERDEYGDMHRLRGQ